MQEAILPVTLKLEGLSAHVQHNIRLADPEDEYKQAIDILTAKKGNKTEAEDAELSRLEFFGGLYYDQDIGVFVPMANVVKCLENAAKITRQGTAVVRAVVVSDTRTPLIYNGPRKPAELYAMPEYRWRTMVALKKTTKIPRVRPMFRRWALNVELGLLTDVMDKSTLERIAYMAGRSEGLGDARKLGYGRFTATIS